MAESRNDLRERIVEAVANAECEKQPKCAQCIADAVLAVRDDALDALRVEVERLRLIARVNDGLHRSAHGEVEHAEATLARVRALAEQWAALAPADDWGETPGATAAADAGRAVLAALDVPADGKQGADHG